MILRISHSTTYRYPSPAICSHNEVRMRPMSDSSQTCFDFQLRVEPHAAINAFETHWGAVQFFEVTPPHSNLTVSVRSLVETLPVAALNELDPEHEGWRFYDRDDVRMDFAEFLAPTRLVPDEPIAREIAAEARAESGG